MKNFNLRPTVTPEQKAALRKGLEALSPRGLSSRAAAPDKSPAAEEAIKNEMRKAQIIEWHARASTFEPRDLWAKTAMAAPPVMPDHRFDNGRRTVHVPMLVGKREQQAAVRRQLRNGEFLAAGLYNRFDADTRMRDIPSEQWGVLNIDVDEFFASGGDALIEEIVLYSPWPKGSAGMFGPVASQAAVDIRQKPKLPPRKQPGRHGFPIDFEAEFNRLAREGRVESSQKRTAQLILEDLAERGEHKKLPAVGTVENNIRQAYNAWDAQNRPTK